MELVLKTLNFEYGISVQLFLLHQISFLSLYLYVIITYKLSKLCFVILVNASHLVCMVLLNHINLQIRISWWLVSRGCLALNNF